MKKLISLILCLVCVMTLNCVAFAEEAEGFSLRNGITFTDTITDVLSKETLEIDEQTETSITTKKGSVAGIADSYIVYYFDDAGELDQVDYHFPSSSYKEFIDSNYDTINDGLTRKYGSPLGFSNGDCYILTKGCLEGAVLMAYLADSLDGGYGDLRDYDEWALEYETNNVKVEHVEYYFGGSYDEIMYCHELSYAKYTDADLEAEQAEKQESRQTVDNDL